MKQFKLFCDLLAIVVTAPIWYYLVYVMLSAAHPDRLVWFLFWVYFPLGLVLSVTRVLTEKAVEKK